MHIKQILKKGNIVAKFDNCIEGSVLAEKLSKDQPDLIVADFDAPKSAREIVEREMEPYYTEVPLIHLVGEDTQHQATLGLYWRRPTAVQPPVDRGERGVRDQHSSSLHRRADALLRHRVREARRQVR